MELASDELKPSAVSGAALSSETSASDTCTANPTAHEKVARPRMKRDGEGTSTLAHAMVKSLMLSGATCATAAIVALVVATLSAKGQADATRVKATSTRTVSLVDSAAVGSATGLVVGGGVSVGAGVGKGIGARVG